jgi:hypothetical protein
MKRCGITPNVCTCQVAMALVFQAYRELIEELASEAHEAEGPFDAHGRILITSEALARVTRSA